LSRPNDTASFEVGQVARKVIQDHELLGSDDFILCESPSSPSSKVQCHILHNAIPFAGRSSCVSLHGTICAAVTTV
jgi:hypothetical protein